MKADEHAFETQICDWLLAEGGYDAIKVGNTQGDPRDFDPVRGIDTAELFAFIGATQAAKWEQLKAILGGVEAGAQSRFVERLAKEIDARGTLDVLRHGVMDRGVEIRLAYFRPAHGLTPELLDRYRANRVTVTRQLPYDPQSSKTVDLALFVNGIPVATAELKNRLTGQSMADAKEQYRTDRDPRNLTLAKRAVVHFAADSERVAMTTRLAGPETSFLPFNLGDGGGAGNPVNSAGHRTSYLWQRVWEREAWLDLLNRFVHVEQAERGSKTPAKVVFPRFHQWDAVLALEAAAREEGPGHHYLVQHSAGSGKSNTIAWLAHRLASLHDAEDEKVFHKVVVITDRRILDRQLQETVHQFEQVRGVVERIDTNSQQLADALAGEQARIIITTLQKFPVVLQKGVDLPDRRYAVIVDEAHSSQTGEAAKDLKLVLGSTPEAQFTAAEAEEAGSGGEASDPVEEALARAAAARTRQDNVSFFAFTATPKARTLELFGRPDPATNRHEPFHLYSMRQAIEEGFILDVLANYVTYETYWQIEKAVEDDPAYDAAKAKTAIARFVALHDHNLSQKAQVIVEHFRTNVAHRLGGKAKAMVVTASRLHAVRYQQALRAYIREQGYDLGVLVAFSGKVVDDGDEATEARLNGFPESQTAEQFATDDWQVLVVAEKYQTGFDQPLLCAMYVDKPLNGLAAVQTLSRLNRTLPGVKSQDDLFVLDFRNDADHIRDAFEPWYGRTVAPPTDPNLLYDTRRELERFDVLRVEEVDAFVTALLGTGTSGEVFAPLGPAVDRFRALHEDDQTEFRDALNQFIRTYSFLSQVVPFSDVKLERDYLAAKAVAQMIRDENTGGLDLGDQVELTHLRLEQTFEGSVSLEDTDGEVTTIFGGTGRVRDPDEEALSEIIRYLNERHGVQVDERDRVFYGTVIDKLAEDPQVQAAAAANTPEAFAPFASKAIEGGVIDQLGVSEAMVAAFLDDPELRSKVLEAYVPLLMGKARVARQEHCPVGELLGTGKECEALEYKSTLRTSASTGEIERILETASLKTIAAFLNSRDGGTLLIGVADDGSVHGLESDYASLHKDGKDDRDRFQLHLGQLVIDSVGAAAATNVTYALHTVDDRDLCRVHVRPCGHPVTAKVTEVDKQGQHQKVEAFYARIGNATRKLNDEEREKYIAGRWPGTPGGRS